MGISIDRRSRRRRSEKRQSDREGDDAPDVYKGAAGRLLLGASHGVEAAESSSCSAVPPRPTADRRTNAEHAPCEGEQGQRRRLQPSTTPRAWGLGNWGIGSRGLPAGKGSEGRREGGAGQGRCHRSLAAAGLRLCSFSVPLVRLLGGSRRICSLYRRGVSRFSNGS